MANNPKKVKDPTEDALSAIQEALNIDGPADGSRNSAHSDVAPDMIATPPSFDDSTFDTRPMDDRASFNAVEETRVALPCRILGERHQWRIGRWLKTSQEAGLKFPVFINRTVWDQYVVVPPKARCQDESGRLWDILWMLRMGIRGIDGRHLPALHLGNPALGVQHENVEGGAVAAGGERGGAGVA